MDDQLTAEQVAERYSGVRLKFDSYYKYKFTFSAVASDGVKIVACYGGNSDDIYRHDVSNNEERPLRVNFKEYWSSINVVSSDGAELFSWFDSY